MYPTLARGHKYAIFGVPIRTMVAALEKTPTPLTLRQLLENGGAPGSRPSNDALLASAAFTQRELPTRLARRVRQFYSLPFLVASNPYIQRVARLYASSFAALDNAPPIKTPEQNSEFVRLLQQLVIDHSDNAEMLSLGFAECGSYMDGEQIGNFLNAALHSRIGIRMIAEQHLSLTAAAAEDDTHYRQTPTSVGIVDTQMRAADVIAASGHYVRNLCEATFDIAPALQLHGDVDVTAVGVPGHLEYVMTELLKNSFRATTERHLSKTGGREIPPCLSRFHRRTRTYISASATREAASRLKAWRASLTIHTPLPAVHLEMITVTRWTLPLARCKGQWARLPVSDTACLWCVCTWGTSRLTTRWTL